MKLTTAKRALYSTVADPGESACRARAVVLTAGQCLQG